jgi:hypothetical protein
MAGLKFLGVHSHLNSTSHHACINKHYVSAHIGVADPIVASQTAISYGKNQWLNLEIKIIIDSTKNY